MKRLFFTTILLAIGVVFATAQTTKTRVMVEAPQGVYISLYQGDYNYMFDGVESDYETINWQDGHGGNGYYWIWGGWMDETCSWPATTWPQPLTNGIATYLPNGGTGVCNPPTLAMEQCNSTQYINDTSQGSWENISKTAYAEVKLATGGKVGSTLLNLWLISVTATSNSLASSDTIQIPNSQIEINGMYPDANGNLYVIAMDNQSYDITPIVKGFDYYTFTISTQKFNSYFEVFVEQANPGYSLSPFGTNDVGHCSWRLTTDAPGDAFIGHTNLLGYLGHTWGFFPDTNGDLCSMTIPGQLEPDGANSGANILRKIYIGFPGLVGGLTYTRATDLAPFPWCWSGNNCANAARNAGRNSGVALPLDNTPQNFGVTLVTKMYPGPFWDDTDIFYSQ
jgi:hypothetical protein